MTAQRTLVVVQARAGSSRLPGKVLADVGGRPMLSLQLERLGPLADLEPVEVVLATSDLESDTTVAEVGERLGVAVVRGPEADVLGRFALALDRHPAEHVVRLTGDCPLTDPQIVADAIALHRSSGADYTSNVLPRSFPKGLDVEVVSAAALRVAAAEATETADREHVTPFVYRRPERFRLANLPSGDDLGQEWWTVDTPADLDHIRDLVAGLDEPLRASWRDVLEVAGRTSIAPGEVHLRPSTSVAPGTSPWPRRWTALVDGTAIGDVTVLVGGGGSGTPVVERVLDVADEWTVPVSQALERLLAGDQQTRP